MALADLLAEWTLSLKFDHLGDQVIRIAKQRIVDSFGCALGAVDSPSAKSIRSYLKTLPDGGATMLFGRKKVTPDAAALLNGTMIRFLDYNDGYFSLEPGHSSDNIAAVLAVAEAEGLTGRDVILAMVVAYEVQMRLQDAACLFRRGWDHVNFVTVSATLAVGKLLGLSKTQLVHALGMALNGHIALRQVRSGELSGWKGASAANATRNAAFCAYLARHGMTGPNDIFEGEMGFFNQVSGKFDLDLAAFGNSESQDFHIKRARTKIYPTNGEMQTAVMAAVDLRAQITDLGAIRSIEVATTDVGFKFLAKDRAKWRPETRETADHSLPYTVARALLDGTITRATYDAADFADPKVLAVVDKITVREDPQLTAEMPSLANRIAITMNDGRLLEREYGTKKNPRITISDAELEGKFRSFATAYYDERRLTEVLGVLWSFDEQIGFDRLFELLHIDTAD